jgi:hypothetical protein
MTTGVNYTMSTGLPKPSDTCDAIPLNRDIRDATWTPSSIHHSPVFDDDVELRRGRGLCARR